MTPRTLIALVKKYLIQSLVASMAFIFSLPGNAVTIAAGSEYLETERVPTLDLGPIPFSGGIGVVDLGFQADAFRGRPTGPGSTDTIFQRLEDADLVHLGGIIFRDIVDARLVTMSLVSINPFTIAGTSYDVVLSLLPTGNGAITVQEEFGLHQGFPPVGGTYVEDVRLPAVLEVALHEVGQPNAPPPTFSEPVTLDIGSFTFWNVDPQPGSLIVTGPRDDLTANRHTGLIPGVEIDLFPDTGTFKWDVTILREENPIGLVQLRAAVPGDAVPDSGHTAILVGLALLWTLTARRFLPVLNLRDTTSEAT